MARQNHGPLSRAKGKLGGVVYQQYEGMQISREYQPVVKNPQTEKQTTNRAKFKMSSQIVAQFKDVLSARLSKLSIYERMRRAASVNAIMAAIDDSTPDNPQALLASVTSAINSKSMSSIPAPIITDTQNDEVLVEGDEGDAMIATMVSYNDKGEVINVLTERWTATSSTFGLEWADGTKTAICMVVALRASTEAGRATISNVTAMATGWQNEIARSVIAGDVAVSQLASHVNVIA